MLVPLRRPVERGIGQVIELAPLVQPGALLEMWRRDLGNRAVDLDHIGLQLSDIALPIAPGDPGGAVVIGQHGRVDILPAMRALGRHLIGDERGALGIDEGPGRLVGNRDRERLAGMAVVMLDGGVEPVFAVLVDRLAGPGVLLGPFEITHVHDWPVRGPVDPASGIPTEPKVQGTRWLDEDEFVKLYRWLDCPDVPVHPSYPRAIQLIMLTGQRVEEIARLHIDQWDPKERIIDWSKTKNMLPHAIPLPSLAAELIESITPGPGGWFFPSAKDPNQPVGHGTLYSFTWRQRDRGVIPFATNRDLRRTWKTLSGKAGMAKEIRDSMQNHTLQDISSKN